MELSSMMDEINASSDEVNQAMEQSREIGDIDSNILKVVNSLTDTMNKGTSPVSNDSLLSIINSPRSSLKS